jgi:hypothetical protein
METIISWIVGNALDVIYITGPTEKEDPGIYKAVTDILETAFYMELIESNMKRTRHHFKTPRDVLSQPHPKTLEEAVDFLIATFPLKERIKLANLEKHELKPVYFSIGEFIRNELKWWENNTMLMESCIKNGHDPGNGDHNKNKDAVIIIVDSLWKELKKTHSLRIIK